MARGNQATARSIPAPKAAHSSAKPAKALASKTAVAKTSAERAPMVTKDELRAQLEKLEGTVATLRAKSRDANRAAKVAAARIAELEGEAVKLKKQAAA